MTGPNFAAVLIKVVWLFVALFSLVWILVLWRLYQMRHHL